MESGVFRVFTQFLINKTGIPSGPGDEETDMVLIAESISPLITSMNSNDMGPGILPNYSIKGMLYPVELYTDVYRFCRILDFSLASYTSSSSMMKGFNRSFKLIFLVKFILFRIFSINPPPLTLYIRNTSGTLILFLKTKLFATVLPVLFIITIKHAMDVTES